MKSPTSLSKSIRAQKLAKGGEADPHAAFNADANQAKAVSDELATHAKSLGSTGSSHQHTVKGATYGAGFKEKESADKHADHLKNHPKVHKDSVKQSSGHGHHFVDARLNYRSK